ncbi:hypothetical protein D3C71_1850790 [compost metagenome]
MLARCRCLQGQRHMQVIGQRVVDGLDGRVGQELFVAAIGLGNAQGPRGRLRGGQGTRGDRAQFDQRAGQHRGDHILHTDLGRAQHAPNHRFHGYSRF